MSAMPLGRCIAVAAALAVSGVAWAQAPAPVAAPSNIEKMKQFNVATTDLKLQTVAQTGRNADAIR